MAEPLDYQPPARGKRPSPLPWLALGVGGMLLLLVIPRWIGLPYATGAAACIALAGLAMMLVALVRLLRWHASNR